METMAVHLQASTCREVVRTTQFSQMTVLPPYSCIDRITTFHSIIPPHLSKSNQTCQTRSKTSQVVVSLSAKSSLFQWLSRKTLTGLKVRKVALRYKRSHYKRVKLNSSNKITIGQVSIPLMKKLTLMLMRRLFSNSSRQPQVNYNPMTVTVETFKSRTRTYRSQVSRLHQSKRSYLTNRLSTLTIVMMLSTSTTTQVEKPKRRRCKRRKTKTSLLLPSLRSLSPRQMMSSLKVPTNLPHSPIARKWRNNSNVRKELQIQTTLRKRMMKVWLKIPKTKGKDGSKIEIEDWRGRSKRKRGSSGKMKESKESSHS